MAKRTRQGVGRQRATEIIDLLEKRGFYAECPDPDCGETIKLSECGLFYGDDFTEDALTFYQGWTQQQRDRAEELKDRYKRIASRSELGAQAVNTGRIWERLAPCMGSFCFDSGDCRSLFDPIDYVVFEGLNGGAVTKVHFLELKTGGARLKPVQKQIRLLVESKKVSLHVYNPTVVNDGKSR
jgi:predicted Holliday junction resolvase-like endonuclease